MSFNAEMTRRGFIRHSVFSAGTSVLASRLVWANPTKTRIGVVAPSHCALPIVHASITERFQEQGVDADIVFKPDISSIVQGLKKKELQAGQIISSVFLALNVGAGPFQGKQTPLVTAQVGGTNGGVLIVAKDSDIKTPKGLAGKTIGIFNPMMVHTLLIKALLKKHGIDLNSVTFKKMGMKELIAALKTGEIDAFINPEPIGTFAVAKQIGRDLMKTKSMWFKHPCCVLAMTRDYYESHQDSAEKVYLASIQSGLVLNQKGTRKAEIEKVHAKSEPYNALALKAMQKAFTLGRSDFDPFPFQSSAQALLLLMKDNGLLPAGTDIEQVSSETFLSDLSCKLITQAGGTAPTTVSRQEKVVGEILVS